MPCQIEFLPVEEKSELASLREEVQHVKGSNDKVRKSMFARHGELARKYTELQERLQIIERNICRSSS